MLVELLEVKKIRERDADRVKREAERALQAALDAVRAAQQAVVDFHEFRIEEEPRLFNKIRGEKVKVKAFDDYKHQVAALRDKEMGMIEEAEALEAKVPPKREALDAATSAHAAAMAAVAKFEELVEIEKQEIAAAAMAREDAEAEEVVEAVFGNPAHGGW